MASWRSRGSKTPVLRLSAAVQAPARADHAAFDADERVGVIRILSQASDRGLARLFAVRIANDHRPIRRNSSCSRN